MNILSAFDGMSCGQIALNRAGVKYDKYFASEVDKYAIQVTQRNYPNTIQIGDICNVRANDLPKINLLIGGSPCQGFSFAGEQLNFDDPRSALFFEFVRLKEELKPDFFLLENVKMKAEVRDEISRIMGVEPVLINSALVSAQNRERLYWTNIPEITQPKDKSILLYDILEDQTNFWNESPTEKKKAFILSNVALEYMSRLRNNKPRWEYHTNLLNGKAATLTANMWKGVPYGVIRELKRRLTPIECERLQTVPDNYTAGVSNTQRYKMLGNGWTVDVIAHIFKGLKS